MGPKQLLHIGPEKCFVASFLDMLRTGRQISAENSSCIIGLRSLCVYMSIPRKIVADQDSQVLCILGVSEFFSMDGVVSINRLPLLGDPDYTFIRVECHEPALFPLL